jgi:iron donor protein CyaY
MDDQEFQKHADDALGKLYRALLSAGDDYGFEADRNNGAISLEFEDPPGKFVISPNSPVRQIWVSAHSKSYKLDWDEVERTFVLGSTGQTLKQLIEEAIGRQVGAEVEL